MKHKKSLSGINKQQKNNKKETGRTYLHKTVLDKYYEGGYLDNANSKYDAEDRKNAGLMLAYDFYMAHYNNLKSPILDSEIIPTTGITGQDAALYFQSRYINAVKSVPREFWPSVRKVCIEDKELIGELEGDRQSLRNKNSVYYQKMLLNHGLDRLFEFYTKKIKKSS